MYESCVDPALYVLDQMYDVILPGHEDVKLKNSILSTHQDLGFFKMFFWGLAYQEQSLEDDCRLHYAWTNMMLKLSKISEVLRMQFESASDAEKIRSWEPMSYHLRRKIDQYKPLVKEICILVLRNGFIWDWEFEDMYLEYGDNTVYLVDLIVKNLGLLDSNFDRVLSLHFGILELKYKVLRKFANHVSCLSCLYWIGETDHKVMAFDMGNMLSDLVQKYMPYSPRVVELYLDVFKGVAYPKFAAVYELTVSYVTFLLEYLVILMKDDTEILRDGLMFVLSFMIDPPKEDSNENKYLLADIYDIYIAMSSLNFMKDDTELCHFLDMIDRVKVRARELYVTRNLSSKFNPPKTDVMGFLNSFLADLEKMLNGKLYLVPFIRDHIIIVQEELVSLQRFLQVNLELESEHKDLWTQITNMAYFASYITKLCSSTHFHVWYGFLCFPDLIEGIMQVRAEVIKRIDKCPKWLKLEMDSTINAFRPEVVTSNNEGTFIGYEQDVEEILNQLVNGTKDLRIISISGMAGQGKTTMAKRIYNDPSIHYYFHRKVWCYVSKECKPRELLSKIINGGKIHGSIDDAADCVRKSLKGKRYLIVMDDIWDVDLWQEMQGAFPNDKAGSRILFTSRAHNLASQAKIHSISHRLRPFSHEESWKLMKEKLCDCDGFPPGFLEIGEEIANLCRGLPLAIALIGALLRRAGPVLNLWNEVAGNLNLYLTGEGCMDSVELSYRYLPDHLKPCFLYFGAFSRGESIHARKLELLWIAEGFVKGRGMQLAAKYLDDLVAQNLVVVTERSSTGRIKECKVHHDLLYDLCLAKCKEDNFIDLAETTITSGTQRFDFHHRLCINDGPFTLQKPTGAKSEFPTSQTHTLLLYGYLVTRECLSNFLSNFRVLTVLDLGDFDLFIFPEVILYNIHLRHISLYGRIPDIPASVSGLWNLETLIMGAPGYNRVLLPDSLWEMESLNYVDIERFWHPQDGLRPNIAAMRSVEVLKGICLMYDVLTVEFLGRFVRLRKLKCYCNDQFRAVHPLWLSMFGSLVNLYSLHLYNPVPLPTYKQQPTLNFPDNLKKLTLVGFRLPWSAMSTIGKLSNLEVLKLRYGACAGITWSLEDGEFSRLRVLKLEDMYEVERIDDSGCCDTPFPCLEKLILRYCEVLEEIPSSFGDSCTLDTIDVKRSPNISDSIRRIIEQQQDMGNYHLQVFGLETSD